MLWVKKIFNGYLWTVNLIGIVKMIPDIADYIIFSGAIPTTNEMLEPFIVIKPHKFTVAFIKSFRVRNNQLPSDTK